MQNTIIHCPTQELFNRVVDRLFEEGIYIGSGSPKDNYFEWNYYKEQTCLRIENMKLCRADIQFYQENYSNTPVIPAEEFLSKGRQEYKTKPKQNMLQILTSALKRALSPELQKLYEAGLINGGLELTERGKDELLSIAQVKFQAEFVARAEEIIAEEEDK